MLASTFGAVAVIAIFALVLGIINPIIAVAVLVIALLPLVLMMTGRLFKHAPGGAQAGTSSLSGGPSVPSSADASYDPVARPGDR